MCQMCPASNSLLGYLMALSRRNDDLQHVKSWTLHMPNRYEQGGAPAQPAAEPAPKLPQNHAA